LISWKIEKMSSCRRWVYFFSSSRKNIKNLITQFWSERLKLYFRRKNTRKKWWVRPHGDRECCCYHMVTRGNTQWKRSENKKMQGYVQSGNFGHWLINIYIFFFSISIPIYLFVFNNTDSVSSQEEKFCWKFSSWAKLTTKPWCSISVVMAANSTLEGSLWDLSTKCVV
jgi:hypothetical protein